MRGKGVLGLALIAMALVMAVGAAVATPGSGVTTVPLASAQIDHQIKIQQGAGEATVVADFTLTPGGTTGWHSHPGKTLVTVQQGTFTVYHDNCHAHVYEAGDAFVELPSSVHVGRNETSGTVKVGVVFTNVPVGGSPRIDQPQPETCDVT